GIRAANINEGSYRDSSSFAQSYGGLVTPDPIGVRMTGRLTLGAFFGQVDAALWVDLRYFDLEAIADFDFIINVLNAIISEFADVDHALFAGEDLDKGAEGEDALNYSVKNFADFDLVGEGLDLANGLLDLILIGAGDVDRTVVGDIDENAVVFNDGIDHLAAGTNDDADFVRIDLDDDVAGSIFAEL